MASSPDHIHRVRAALPHDPAVPVSAATERWLCSGRRAGRVVYADGAAAVTALDRECGGWPGGCRYQPKLNQTRGGGGAGGAVVRSTV